MGVALGLVYLVLGLVVLQLRGGFALLELRSVLKLTASFVGGGLWAGVIVGALRPLLVRKAAAIVVGIISLLPAAAGIHYLFNERSFPWALRDYFVVVAWASVFGTLGALALWREFRETREEPGEEQD
jgi:hypothetical protein